MSKNITILFICCFCSCTVLSQTYFPTEDSVHTFWQPQKRIVYNDYKWPTPSNDIYAEIALWTVMDLPLHAKMLKPDQMKIYVAPVCDKHLSRADTNDAGKIAIDNILFDILELSAREARVKISNLPDSSMSVEELSKIFKVIVRQMHETRLRMNRKFYREVFYDKKKDALQTWQQKLKQELSNTAKWATQPVECYRFLQNQPLETGYYEDINSNAKLIGKTEQVLDRDTWHAEFCQISRLRK